MADRYLKQFSKSYLTGEVHIAGYVGVGTGGQPNAATASGVTYGPFLNQASGSVPTGWAGGFSGTQGLYGGGLQAVSRIATGTYSLLLKDQFQKLNGVQLIQFGQSGVAPMTQQVISDTVDIGNTQAAGANQIIIQFLIASTGVGGDLPNGGGFFVDLTLINSYTNVGGQ